MKIKRFAAMTLALLAVGVLATAQIKPMSGKVLVPDSSIEKPTDIGHAAHTNIQVFLPKELLRNEQTSGPPYGGYAYETPASLACVYGLVTPGYRLQSERGDENSRRRRPHDCDRRRLRRAQRGQRPG